MLSNSDIKQKFSTLGFIIFIIILLSILLRVVLHYWDNVPFLFSDSGAYIGQAFSLSPAHDRPLGYAVFLRSIFVLSLDLNSVIYIQSALGVITILGFYYLGRKYLLHSRYGLVLFLLLAAFDLRLILFEHYILSETLLRKYAIESILTHPRDYLITVFKNLYRLYSQRVGYTSHMSWVLMTNAATKVRHYFGPNHPSLKDIESPI